MSAEGRPSRIPWLDAWRGVAVLVMLGWHFCWDLGLLGLIPLVWMKGAAAVSVRLFIVCSFTLISGICARFTRNGLRRGAITLGAGLLVTAVTWLAGQPVWFGILHLLGCCMILYALLGKGLERLPEKGAFFGYFLAFLVLYRICYSVRVPVPGLFIFGLRTPWFRSADYYPLFPWGFLFLMGTVLGGSVRHSSRAWPEGTLPAPLRFVGRHALWIYLLHQPVLLGLLALCTGRTI